jgi:6-phosphogluconolactonase
MKITLYFVLPALILIAALLYYNKDKTQMKKQGTEFYVGTYTNKNSEGIYKYSLLDNGNIELIGLVAKSENPSFITKSADHKYLIAVNENNEGTVESFKINDDNLQFINKSSSGGVHPCFVTTNGEEYILVANYSSGNIGLLKVMSNGKLSPLLDVQQHYGEGTNERQKSPHAHSAWINPADGEIISVDLGTNELIFSSIDSKLNKFTPLTQDKLKMDSGAGPRHLAFHPDGQWIYVVNELNSTVSLIKKDESGFTLKSSFTTLPKNYTEESTCADIHISSDGRFLYASNRGHNSIAIFSIESDGELLMLGQELTRGNGPRNFALSPDNNFLLVANQYSENIVAFKRDTETGRLEYISETKAHVPVCILF